MIEREHDEAAAREFDRKRRLHLVCVDEAMHRGTMYRDFETHAREAECNLLKKEVE